MDIDKILNICVCPCDSCPRDDFCNGFCNHGIFVEIHGIAIDMVLRGEYYG